MADHLATKTHPTLSRQEWRAAREKLLAEEKEHTRRGDELARKRRELPWLPVEKEYRLDTDEGERTLMELFDGRSQLLVYHFMFGPSYEAGDPVNSSMVDGFDGLVPHLHARDLTLMLVSRAPLAKLQAYKRRMGWSVPWASSANSDFNFDLGASSTEQQLRAQMPKIGGREVDRSRSARGIACDRASERGRLWHRRPELHLRITGGERLCAPGRWRLPDLYDHLAWPRVHHGLLPHPRPCAEGTRRGRRGLADLDSPPRRVRAVLTTEVPLGHAVHEPTDNRAGMRAGSGIGLAVASMTTVQLGYGLSEPLFDRIGAAGTVALRLALAALILWPFARPRLRGRSRTDLGAAVAAARRADGATRQRPPAACAGSPDPSGTDRLPRTRRGIARHRRRAPIARTHCSERRTNWSGRLRPESRSSRAPNPPLADEASRFSSSAAFRRK